MVGKAAGDAKLEAEGKADKVEGKVQNAVGGLKDTLKSTASTRLRATNQRKTLLASAAMDRLLHGAHVLILDGDSYRNPPPERTRKAARGANKEVS